MSLSEQMGQVSCALLCKANLQGQSGVLYLSWDWLVVVCGGKDRWLVHLATTWQASGTKEIWAAVRSHPWKKQAYPRDSRCCFLSELWQVRNSLCCLLQKSFIQTRGRLLEVPNSDSRCPQLSWGLKSAGDIHRQLLIPSGALQANCSTMVQFRAGLKNKIKLI